MMQIIQSPGNLRLGNKLPALFLKKPLCVGDLLPMHKIVIERPASVQFLMFGPVKNNVYKTFDQQRNG